VKNTALITGASSGIGLELARIHASKGDNLVIVARNKQKLDELKSELESKYGVSVLTIGIDLSVPDAPKEVYAITKAARIRIDYLINNAGFGNFSLYADSDWEINKNMIHVNILAVSQFIRLYLPEMIERKNGKILNLASSAAFMPGPLLSVYYATKAYVLSLSQGVNSEISKSGVTMTALCPGPTDTGFAVAADAVDSRVFKKIKMATPRSVAEYGYHAMMKGKPVALDNPMVKTAVFIFRFIPRSWIPILVRWGFSKVN